jgi:hypothetical protein
MPASGVLYQQVQKRRQFVVVAVLAGQLGCQVEAETVDVHLGDPVAQAVGDELQGPRVAEIERVPGSGHVVGAPRIVGEVVVGGVVQAAERQGRAQLVAFGGVVVDDVEEDRDPGAVQRRHHRLEFLHDAGRVAGGGQPRVGGEKAEGVVPPVVGEPVLDQKTLADPVMHRQQFHRVDAQPGEVLDRGRGGQPRIGAAQARGDAGVAHREALDMQFVDDGVGKGTPRRRVGTPGEGAVDDRRPRRVRRAVPGVEGQVLLRTSIPVSVEGVGMHQVPADRLGVGVEQQLVDIATQTAARIVGSVGAQPVQLPRPDVWKVAVPDPSGLHRQRESCAFPRRLGRLEKAQIDIGGLLGEDRHVDASAVPGRSERMGSPVPHAHDPPPPPVRAADVNY